MRSRLSLHARRAPTMLALALWLPACAAPPSSTASAARACAPLTGDAATWLQRSIAALGVDRHPGQMLHISGFSAVPFAEQSDRTYPPYILAMGQQERWLDVDRGLEWYGAADATRGTATSAAGAYAANGGQAMANPVITATNGGQRAFDPWAVLLDWREDTSARVIERCTDRDADRIVLERDAAGRTERLFLDPETAFLMRLERSEPHYLWGDVDVSYLYQTYWRVARGSYFPVSVTRLMDGREDGALSAFPGAGSVVPDSAGPHIPDPPPSQPLDDHVLRQYAAATASPDTVRVDDHTFLLSTPYYTETVALLADTVFLLDATTGEDRARQDSLWIGRLFPGDHPVTVVVTDLAWPHIAGVRFWAASGATLVTGAASRGFLETVLARHWPSPDRLEERRAEVGDPAGRIRTVGGSLRLAGGALTLHPIDGAGSEGALLAYLQDGRLLWASDFIQTTRGPSLYALEVWRAAQRVGLRPDRVVAMHLPLSPWAAIDSLVRSEDPPPAGG